MAEQPVIRVDAVEQVDARTGESVEGVAKRANQPQESPSLRGILRNRDRKEDTTLVRDRPAAVGCWI